MSCIVQVSTFYADSGKSQSVETIRFPQIAEQILGQMMSGWTGSSVLFAFVVVVVVVVDATMKGVHRPSRTVEEEKTLNVPIGFIVAPLAPLPAVVYGL